MFKTNSSVDSNFRASANGYRDLTIRQRRHPWKRPRKRRHFKLFRDYPNSPCYLKEREFWPELKRAEHAQVRTEMVKFIALPFPLPSKFQICSFHAVAVQWRQRNVKKAWCTCRVVVLLIKPIVFLRSRCRRRRGFARSLIMLCRRS